MFTKSLSLIPTKLIVRSYSKEGQQIKKGDSLNELDTSKTTHSGVVVITNLTK